ncbi:hypothetical protein PSCLAVI8L_220113 [Pseudoclavibacter sp. 8L]|nr:hypothetical protein PSCLAVI8L_220113 [Pseudoclavibacter sp. 8L]
MPRTRLVLLLCRVLVFLLRLLGAVAELVGHRGCTFPAVLALDLFDDVAQVLAAGRVVGCGGRVLWGGHAATVRTEAGQWHITA